MNQRDLQDAMGAGLVPYSCVCAQTGPVAPTNPIELNYQFYDITGEMITSPMNLRVAISTATGDAGAVVAQAAANLGTVAIGNTRGLILDKMDTDGEFCNFYVRAIEPGPKATVPTNTDSAFSLQLTHNNVAGATLYVKIYNQNGFLIDETAVTWA